MKDANMFVRRKARDLCCGADLYRSGLNRLYQVGHTVPAGVPGVIDALARDADGPAGLIASAIVILLWKIFHNRFRIPLLRLLRRLVVTVRAGMIAALPASAKCAEFCTLAPAD
jgi:hypothetical protein